MSIIDRAMENLNLTSQPIYKTDQVAAVAALASERCKELGGDRVAQDWAASKSKRMLDDGFSGATAIECAAKTAVRRRAMTLKLAN